MADESPQEAATEKVQTAHVIGAISQSISTDASTALMVLKLVGDGRLGLTMDVDQLRWFRAMVSTLINMATTRGQAKRQFFHNGENFEVGHSDEMRNHVFITFDPEMETEAVYAFTNISALRMVDAVQRDVLSRMTMDERRKAIMAKSKIILPGQ